MRLILSAFLLASLVACSTKEPDTYVEAPVEQLYNDATDAMTDGRFGQAAKLFDEVERQHPYSIWATKAPVCASCSCAACAPKLSFRVLDMFFFLCVQSIQAVPSRRAWPSPRAHRKAWPQASSRKARGLAL